MLSIGGLQVEEGMHCVTCDDKLLRDEEYGKAAAIAGKALAPQDSWITVIIICGSDIILKKFCSLHQ